MEFFNNLPILNIQEDWKNKNLYIHCYVSNGFVPNNGLILTKPFVDTHKYSYFVCNKLEKKNTSINMLGYNGPNILENLFPEMYQFELEKDENLDFDKMYKSNIFKKIYKEVYKHKKEKQFLLFSFSQYGIYFTNKYMKEMIKNRDLYNLSIMIIDKNHMSFMKKDLDYVLHFNVLSSHTLRRIYDNFFYEQKEQINSEDYSNMHYTFYHEYRNEKINTYFIYKKNAFNLFDLHKYEIEVKEIDELTKNIENGILRLCNDEVWERNKYISIKNTYLDELLFLFIYKKLFKKMNFNKIDKNNFCKNIFIGSMKEDIQKQFYHKIENIEPYYILEDHVENNKFIKTIYENGYKKKKAYEDLREEAEKNNKKEKIEKVILPIYILLFKNIHHLHHLYKKSYFENLFHYNKSLNTSIYIYQDKIVQNFFSDIIDIEYYSSCNYVMDFYDDNPLYYNDINYIIIDLLYIKENMKLMYDELFHIFIPIYSNYEKIINHYIKKYSIMIICYDHFHRTKYNWKKDINKIIYFY